MVQASHPARVRVITASDSRPMPARTVATSHVVQTRFQSADATPRAAASAPIRNSVCSDSQ